MSTYILVHGGDRDGTLWKDVAPMLEKSGHRVYCPSMESVKTASLLSNIEQIVDLIIDSKLSDIILCGHSYGAMVITGVSDRCSENIRTLVFVDSIVPENGKSLYGWTAEHGMDYQDFGLTADPACLEPLYFDESSFNLKTKVYIHCLQSEFKVMVDPLYQELAKDKHWLTMCLDAPHGCMFTQPKQLGIILAGIDAV
jgi:pimeloyl-ACP methyl ester carboxylesterase